MSNEQDSHYFKYYSRLQHQVIKYIYKREREKEK